MLGWDVERVQAAGVSAGGRDEAAARPGARLAWVGVSLKSAFDRMKVQTCAGEEGRRSGGVEQAVGAVGRSQVAPPPPSLLWQLALAQCVQATACPTCE